MIDKNTEETRQIWENFKHMAIAAHPENTKAILELDTDQVNRDNNLARALTDQEMEQYQPLSAEEITASLDLLEGFGLKMD